MERIRTEQDAKARLLVERRDEERKEFLQLARPVLGELLGERQATAILDKGLVIASLSSIDITDEAIAIDDLIQDPVETVSAFESIAHPRIPQPVDLYRSYGIERSNSMGVNLANDDHLRALAEQVNA